MPLQMAIVPAGLIAGVGSGFTVTVALPLELPLQFASLIEVMV